MMMTTEAKRRSDRQRKEGLGDNDDEEKVLDLNRENQQASERMIHPSAPSFVGLFTRSVYD